VRAALVLGLIPFIVGAILRWPFFGLLLFIATDFVRPQDLTWGFEEVRFALTLSLATLVAFAVQRKSFKPVTAPSGEKWMLLLGFGMLLSMATAVSVEVAWDWNSRFLKILVFCLLLARMTDSRERLDKAIATFVFGVGALGAWAFLQHFQGNERLEGIGNGGDQNNSNHLGAVFVLVFPFSVAVATNLPKGWLRRGAFALIPVFLADIVFTQSRAAYIALVTMIGVGVLKKKIRRKVLLFCFVGAIVAIPVGFEKYKDRFETTFTDGTRGVKAEDGSIGLRFLLWQHALEFFSRNPLTGVGSQNAGVLIKTETSIGKAKSIHNTYLQLLADLGLLGFTAWLGALLAGLRDARTAQRVADATDDPALWRYSLACEMAIIGFFPACGFHSFEYIEPPYWVVCFAGVIRGLAVRGANLEVLPSRTPLFEGGGEGLPVAA
jgi:probable O-glycosylation ligase (exosortase A-associated)